MTQPTLEGVQRSVRDGIPVYWVPRAPRLTGALMFRAGRCDETAMTGGVSHLVEHLALFGLGANQPYSFNGRVDGVRTVFHATGTPEEVSAFMRRTCHALADLPLQRVAAEGRVLRTEAAGRTTGPLETMLWFRFGSAAHGLSFLREFALESPDVELIRRWAAERFTAENAIAWFTGPIPESISFAALPSGRRIPCPEAIPLPRLRTPAFVGWKPGGISISFITERANWIVIPWQIAVTRIQDRLRFQKGLTYSVSLAAHPLSATHLHSALVVGCLDEHAGAVRDGLLEVLDDLATNGPRTDELSQMRDKFLRILNDPESASFELESAATNELIGSPVTSFRQQLTELEAMRPEQCAAAVRAAMNSALLMLPANAPPPKDRFTAYPISSVERVTGRRFRTPAQKFPWSKKGHELIVGREGVSIVSPKGDARTVSYKDCAGVVVQSDGSVLVLGQEPVVLLIRASDWHHGQEACEALTKSTPAGLLRVFSSR